MLVARCASVNGSRAAKCGYAHASRKWFTSFTLREDSRAPTSLRSPTSNTHSLPRASCANPFTHVLAQASLDSSVCKSLLRREGDSNPRNPFGVYTLSRRASSTTRASLLRRNWLARRNSPCEFGLPPLLLLTRAHEALVIFSWGDFFKSGAKVLLFF